MPIVLALTPLRNRHNSGVMRSGSKALDWIAKGLKLGRRIVGEPIARGKMNEEYYNTRNRPLYAVSPALSLFNPTITDVRGDVLGYYDSAAGSNTWISARPTGYGAVPGYRPVALASGEIGRAHV